MGEREREVYRPVSAVRKREGGREREVWGGRERGVGRGTQEQEEEGR